MKHYFNLLAAMCAAIMLSCQKADLSELVGQSNAEVTKNVKDVQFVLKGLEVDYVSRATLSSESLTDLWVYEGTTLLKHQVSTDADFGAPTVSLAIGAHDLTFVASKAEGQTFTEGLWKSTRVNDTYGCVLSYTASKSSTSKQVELKRVNAKVMWTIEDQIPQSASTMSFSLGTCFGLSAALAGVDSGKYSRDGVDITSKRGAIGTSFSAMVLPATYGEESDCETVITIKDADDKALCSYSKSVKVLNNRATNIHGTFFSSGGGMSVSLANEWAEVKDVDL